MGVSSQVVRYDAEQWRILAVGASDNSDRAWQELWTLRKSQIFVKFPHISCGSKIYNLLKLRKSNFITKIYLFRRAFCRPMAFAAQLSFPNYGPGVEPPWGWQQYIILVLKVLIRSWSILCDEIKGLFCLMVYLVIYLHIFSCLYLFSCLKISIYIQRTIITVFFQSMPLQQTMPKIA
jgi:hypothetical protein